MVRARVAAVPIRVHSLKLAGQVTLLPPENLGRQRPPTHLSPTVTRGQKRARPTRPAPRPVAAAAEARAAEPCPVEPPPSYNEAIAWTPPVNLNAHSEPLLSRPQRENRRPMSSAAAERLPMHRDAGPERPRTQYDGLTGRRTRPIEQTPVVDPATVVPPRPSPFARYDGLSRQRTRPLSESAQSPDRPSARPSSASPVAGPSIPPEERKAASAPNVTTSSLDDPWEIVEAPADERKAPSVPRPLPPLPLADATDLDVLLARIDRAAQPEYTDLTQLADFLGPARAPPRVAMPEGVVEVARRRVTRDGRVKLKLALLGASVERCGACLAQFREHDRAAVLQPCGHAAHAECARKWFLQSATCPLCRHDLAQAASE